MRFPTILNIRQKVMAGFTLLLIITGFFGAVSFSYLREVERKQHFVETADDLRDFILEARRYEKNFLLYGSADDLEENRRFTQLGSEMLDKAIPENTDLQGVPLLNQIKRELAGYQRLMNQLAPGHSGSSGLSGVEDPLREHGKSLVDLSQRLVSFERERILRIVKSLKTLLLISLGVTIIGGGLLIPVISRKIVRPLRYIERTTHRIAEGDFTPIEVYDTRDETQRVVEGFNRMISELEKRQDQLLQAKKMSSLGTLTSGIAHQLNNPLNNISTSCQILLEEFDKSDAEFSHRMLNNIEHEVHRARDIVRGLLEFSRIREFCLAPTALFQVVERSVKLISSHVPPGVEILLDVPHELSLNLDAQRMQQVFLNLIENAVQAIEPPGQITIKARADLDQNQVLITVEDTGNGIPEAELGRIFDPFFTTKEVGLGTGLGLSVVFGIVQKHHGSISVESRQSEGTRFTIRFPIEKAC
ncbi:MAG: ATP-binding protein [Syntrophobacteraceae bacterium]